MKTFELTPTVDSTQEFIEIAKDFSNPLDLVREAISNSFDAQAKNIALIFEVITEYGEKVLSIRIRDDGTGMDRRGLQSFFDLGNSTRRGDSETIGEKGHGTKVFFNSKEIKVETVHDGIKYVATMNNPIIKLHDRMTPTVEVVESTTTEPNGTKIYIKGYNNNRRDRFTHAILKDYIQWFTKMGSIEQEFGITKNKNVTLRLKGIDAAVPEDIKFGHFFPKDSIELSKLFDEYLTEAPKRYSKKIIRRGQLDNFPEISYEAVFCLEGTKVKYDYNPMIRRSGYTAPKGAYTIQERYGIWLCKDYIPVQRKNEWITSKGSEYTKFHAFFNCQGLSLTANRGSIENTHSEIIEDIKKAVRKLYDEIILSDDWIAISYLEDEANAFLTKEKEQKDFKYRIDRVNKTKIAEYNGQILVEPAQENGVFALYMQLKTINPEIFPFTVVDYDTRVGIDVIVKENSKIPLKDTKLYYVEFKNVLKKSFNHSFCNLYSIVCWDIDSSVLKHGETIEDLSQEERVLEIVPPEDENDVTRYFLDNKRKGRKIEIIVLKQYLQEKFGITFKPRTAKDIY